MLPRCTRHPQAAGACHTKSLLFTFHHEHLSTSGMTDSAIQWSPVPLSWWHWRRAASIPPCVRPPNQHDSGGRGSAGSSFDISVPLPHWCLFVCLFVWVNPENLYFTPCVWREVITPGNGCIKPETLYFEVAWLLGCGNFVALWRSSRALYEKW